MTLGVRPLVAEGARYTRCPMGEELEWQAEGLCHDPNYSNINWFPEPPTKQVDSARAKEMCLACPVLLECRTWALTRHEMHGVWGGMSERDRVAYWKRTENYVRYKRRPKAA